MEQNTEQFMEALEVSKKIEEAGGVAQAFKTIGRGIANAFGTAAGNAKRNAAAAQDAQQTAQTNAQTAQTKAQTNAMDDITLAKTINDAVTKAVGICDKGLEALNKQQPQQGEQKPQQDQSQNNQAPANSEKGGARQLNDQEEQERMGESLNFISALQEAANNNTKTFYNKAKKLLANVQQLVRPFLTGQKKFTAQDIDAVSNAINDQSVQQVLGKNDKKSLKIIQNLNAALNTKKETLGQEAQPEQPKDPAQGGNPDTQKAGETVDPNKQPAQGDAAAGTDSAQNGTPAQGDANAQGEKPTGTDGAVQKVEQRIDNAALDQAIQGLNQFSKYKPIKAVIDEWAKFKQAMEQTKQA